MRRCGKPWSLFLQSAVFLSSNYMVASPMRCNSSDNDTKPNAKPRKCSEYNDWLSFFDGSLPSKCANDPSCMYKRSTFSGQCVKKDEVIDEVKSGEVPVSITDRPIRIYAEIIGSDAITKGLQPIKVLVNETFVESALGSIKDSHAIATSLGKDIVINILDESESRGKLGEWLQYIFSYESVRGPTRNLIYWSLSQEDMIYTSSTFLRLQMAYWLSKHMKHSKEQLLLITDNFLKSKQHQSEVILPLLKWTFQFEVVQAPIANAIVESIPNAKVNLTLHIKSQFVYLFTSLFDSQDLATEGLIYLVKQLLSSDYAK
jgi:hypothetical protein